MAMRCWPLLLCLGTIGCHQGGTRLAACEDVNNPKLVAERCYVGDPGHRKYVGDRACFPFSAPERFVGTWRVALESSEIQTQATPEAEPMRAWLDVEKPPPSVATAMRGDRPRTFAVELVGWRSICKAHYGPKGTSPYKIIVDHFLDLREIGLPEPGSS
jgi:hypothetical protein